MAPAELEASIVHQVGGVLAFARDAGVELRHVKPHGALYNRVVHDEDQARAVLTGSGDLPVLGLPGSIFLELAEAFGREVHREGFPDRAYTPEGRLVPRDQPGAVHHEPSVIAARALEMARSGQVASVCVHGDSPAAVRSAAEVRRTLETAGLTLRSFT